MLPAFLEAARQSLRAARQNLTAVFALEGAMAVAVAFYYVTPAGAAAFSRIAAWQHAGGVWGAAAATALAGGLLSEVSVVYFQKGGRWTSAHAENAAFKLALFFISGAAVYEFYRQQAVWFGTGASWTVLLPKILVDQFGYTAFFAAPFVTVMTRWQNVRYSFRRLWQQLDRSFLAERFLPVLVTNWLLWFPAITLIYAMPLDLQTPLFILATAIWGILLSAIARNATPGEIARPQEVLVASPPLLTEAPE